MSMQGLHKSLLEEHMVEILSIVQDSTTFDIRRKALELATDLINPWSKDDVINFLESEIWFVTNEMDAKDTSTHEYWEFIITRVNLITQEFPETIPEVLRVLIENFICLGGEGESTAVESALFLRNVLVESSTNDEILDSIRENLMHIKSAKVMRILVWCLGEFSSNVE